MKEINKSIAAMIASMLMLLAPALLLLSLSNKCSAQANFLVPSIYSDVSAGGPGGHTNCDVKQDYIGDTVLAWVSPDHLNWAYNGYTGSTGFQHAGSNYFSDVAISIDASSNHNVWIMVVYYSHPDYYLETYEWNSISHMFNYNATLTLESTIVRSLLRSTINIDEEYGNFVIVWPDSVHLNAWTGVNGSAGPVLTGSYQPLYTSISSSDSFQYRLPDVAIYSISTSSPDVYISYIDSVNNLLDVDEYTFSSSSGLSLNGNIFNTSINGIAPPRIACAPRLNSIPAKNEDWTVVWADPTTDIIYGETYNMYTNTGYSNIYTDLCTTDIDLATEQNFDPVVTYSSSYNITGSGAGGIMVAWITYGIDPSKVWQPFPYFYGRVPLAEKCDVTGAEVTNCNYLVIPTNQNTDWLDYQIAISLAGRDYPWVASSNDDIFYVWDAGVVNSTLVESLERKEITYSGGNSSSDWRKQNNMQTNQILNGVYPNPSTGTFNLNVQSEIGETIKIEIFNSLDQEVYSSEEESRSTFYTKAIALKNYSEGIYFIRETGSTTTNNWKIAITN
jgi:hypothetical protein